MLHCYCKKSTQKTDLEDFLRGRRVFSKPTVQGSLPIIAFCKIISKGIVWSFNSDSKVGMGTTKDIT